MTNDAALPDRTQAHQEVDPPYAIPAVHVAPTDAERMVENTVEYGWYSISERRSIALDGDNPWFEAEADPQTTAALHSWEPIDPFLFAHSFDPASPLDRALRYAREWYDLGLAPAGPDLGSAGRRALRLAYLAAATADAAWLARADELATALDTAIDRADGSLATLDGLIGLVTLNDRLAATGLDSSRDASAAVDSLVDRVNAAFTADGVHRSRSPGIHAQVLDRITHVIDAGSVPPGSLDTMRVRAERFLAWIIDPTGAPANIGDTTAVPLTTAYSAQPSALRFIPERFVEPSLVHAESAGRFGAPPGPPIAVFEHGGFAVMKTPWPDRSHHRKAAHLVMSTAASDAVHGPLLTWHDRGFRLLVEPGLSLVEADHPGFDIGAQPHSHNSVAFEPPPAETPNARLVRWGSHRNRLHAQAQVQYGSAGHERTVVLDPGRWLLIMDRVDAPADSDVTVRFHAGDELDLMAAGDGYTLLSGPKPVAWAVALADGVRLVPERGRSEPVANGWWSPDGLRMVPNWVFGWDGRGSTTFTTLISLDGRPTPDEVGAPWIGWHTPEYRVRVAVTEWGVSDVVVEPTTDEEGL